MTPPPSALSPSRKRGAEEDAYGRSRDRERGRREGEEEPWWEHDRRGAGEGGRDSHSQPSWRGGRNEEGGRQKGGRYEGRGWGRGGEQARDGRGQGRDGYRVEGQRGQGSSRGQYGGGVRGEYEEGEVPYLNYDSPSQAATTAPSSISSSSLPAPVASTSTAAIDGVEMDLELPEADPEAILAERRRKRAEILAKYSKGTADSSRAETPEVGTPVDRGTPGPVDAAIKRLKEGTESPSSENGGGEGAFDLFKDASENEASRLGNAEIKAEYKTQEGDELNAGDYNPDEDRKEDDRRQAYKEGGKAPPPVIEVDLTSPPRADDDDDEDDDDMFSLGVKPVSFDDGKPKAFVAIDRSMDASGLTDNFDDAEGYYKLVLGEVLDGGRYQVHANLGKGMFSSVVRARDTESPTGEEVAIKVIRSQESMYKAGIKEVGILKKLQDADPTDKKHVIRLYRTFEHRGHLCLVFESLSMNLREVVKRFGKDVGINLRAVRAYASQMFLALALMKKCDIMHADIKPDNILVSESKSVLKICDLGSASDVSENEITPYLASRFYRAPEIILGLPYDCALDTWSIGCTLYELYTGKILFPGRTNNHMLQLMMELKGKLSHKLIKRARFGEQHFDETMNFLALEKNGTVKTISIPTNASSDLRNRLMPQSAMKKLKEDEVKLLASFVDLLDKMLALDPTKRPTPKDMLNHPFVRSN